MHSTTMLGRALTPAEVTSARMLDALIAFRTHTGLHMDGSGDGGDGGQGGDGSDGDKGDGDGKGSGGDTGDGDKGKGGDSGKGFPDSTPVADMKPAEQTAYWKHQAQKHEGRNRDLLAITGGKHGDDLRADIDELGTLRKEKLSPSDKALADAKDSARAELLPTLAETAFRVAIGDRKTETEVDEFIADLNLTRFIKDGKVDTAKVLERVQQYAPAKGADDGDSKQRDFGQGRRGNGQHGKSGIAAGADMFADRRGKKSSTTS